MRGTPVTSIGPEMSVVLVTRGGLAHIRETVDRLRGQTARDRLELVVVAGSAAELGPGEDVLAAFHSWCVAEVGPAPALARSLAAGVRLAAAPIVALAEEHSFPEPGWAEALIRAHDGRRAVVGPAVLNANPGTRTARADYVLTHGRFGLPASGGERDELPPHNSAYRREVLLGLGDRLEESLAAETLLWWRLRAEGHRLYFEPAARTRHLSVSLLGSWIASRFLQSRLFGATRGRRWPLWRRLAYVCGAPLIPPLRLWRLVRVLPRGQEGVLAALPLVIVGLAVEAVGEAAGYVLGEGDAGERLSTYELNRRLFARAAPEPGDLPSDA